MISKSSRMLTSCVALAAIATCLSVAPAHAGLFDKINKAVNKITQAKDSVESAKETAESVEGTVSAAGATAAPAVATPATPAVATPAAAAAPAPPRATSAASGGTAIPIPANFGTAEGTNAIIKAAPKLSAGDFTLGMPADEAIAKMKAMGMLQGDESYANRYFSMAHIPDHPLLGSVSGANDKEHIDLSLTMYPSAPAVSGIRRVTQFAEGTWPTVETTLAALRKKYGPETNKDAHDNALYWLFDYQGHKLNAAQYGILSRDNCQEDEPNIRFAIGETDVGRRVSEGVPVGPPGSRSVGSAECMNVIVMKAVIGVVDAGSHMNLTADQGWDKINGSLVRGLDVFISDLPMYVSSITATRNLELGIVGAARQKELDAAKTRKAPDL
jgi:hypothetical protein